MNQELEALVLAFDAAQEESPHEVARQSVFEERLKDFLARQPGLSQAAARQMIHWPWRRWKRAQEHPSSLPPQA